MLIVDSFKLHILCSSFKSIQSRIRFNHRINRS